VLYYNYLSKHEYGSNDAVVDALTDVGFPMCRKTMTVLFGAYSGPTIADNTMSTYPTTLSVSSTMYDK